jgi:hypothetical protein
MLYRQLGDHRRDGGSRVTRTGFALPTPQQKNGSWSYVDLSVRVQGKVDESHSRVASLLTLPRILNTTGQLNLRIQAAPPALGGIIDPQDLDLYDQGLSRQRMIIIHHRGGV